MSTYSPAQIGTYFLGLLSDLESDSSAHGLNLPCTWHGINDLVLVGAAKLFISRVTSIGLHREWRTALECESRLRIWNLARARGAVSI